MEFNVTAEEDYMIVDNFYKDPDAVVALISKQRIAPLWKYYNPEASRNTKDYYDCRVTIQADFSLHFAIIRNLVYTVFEDKSDFENVTDQSANFNVYRTLKRGRSKNLQMNPHVDHEYNALVFLDKVESGGTALYSTDSPIENHESTDLFHDVSALGKRVIPAKYNRLAIFKGHQWHGGYVENHDAYIDNWRITQVYFLAEK